MPLGFLPNQLFQTSTSSLAMQKFSLAQSQHVFLRCPTPSISTTAQHLIQLVSSLYSTCLNDLHRFFLSQQTYQFQSKHCCAATKPPPPASHLFPRDPALASSPSLPHFSSSICSRSKSLGYHCFFCRPAVLMVNHSTASKHKRKHSAAAKHTKKLTICKNED